MKIFKKILIANRGEIAVRIIKSAQKLGIETVAVYSEADENSLHIRMASEAHCIGKQELSETYLNIDKLINVAQKAGCDALHPGYGFLAESPLLIKACNENNITFIGPHSRAIQLMGNKIEARSFVKKLNIPMTEGITGTAEELLKKADTINFPLLVKAAAGGGGKGMRIVHKNDNLKEILESTSREAKNYFGNGTIYIEKYIEEPRHIEIQILGDNYGNVIHLFERECTIQRRYQKIIEESPSSTLTPEIRKQMGLAAVEIAKKIEYNSAGTIEFLVDKHLRFYFLEMNTRIQVEHPVTEMVTGVDIVEEQILTAAGNPLRLSQKNILQTGNAIECRIYAEDPANNFLPSPGKMTLYIEPSGNNIRIDTGIDKAIDIKSFFDPMISKLVVWGENRKIATEKSIAALKKYTIHGIKTNISFLLFLLQHRAFEENELSTKFCDTHTKEILQQIDKLYNEDNFLLAAFSFFIYNYYSKQFKKNLNTWENIGYWRHNMLMRITVEKKKFVFEITKINDNNITIIVNGKTSELYLKNIKPEEINFNFNDRFYKAHISKNTKGTSFVSLDSIVYQVSSPDILTENMDYVQSGQDDGTENLFAPMPGKVIKINIKKGDKVHRGTVLLVVEAMKMENNIVATKDAEVEDVNVKEGDMVDTDLQLVYLKKDS